MTTWYKPSLASVFIIATMRVFSRGPELKNVYKKQLKMKSLMSNSPGDREFPLLLRFSLHMKLGHKLQSSNSHTVERVENNCFKGNHH